MGERDAEKIGFELDREEIRHATTAFNAFEIFYGANHSERKQENVQKVRVLLQRLDLLPLDMQASERGGAILADLAASGQTIEFRDAMIAGIVLESGFTLVTKNKGHFARIPKLKLETW